MNPQATFMITARIHPSREADLRTLLASMNSEPGMADPRNALVPFYQFARLHFARFTILEAKTNEDIRAHGVEPVYWLPVLAFIGDIDGDIDIFLAELVTRAGSGLRRIFAHCESFDATQTNLLTWLHARNNRPSANYVNWRGRTVRQVREERDLANALRQQLPQVLKETSTDNPQAIHAQLKAFIEEEIATLRLSLGTEEPTPPGWAIRNFAHLVGVPLALLALTPIMLIGSPVYFIWLRRLEKTEPEILAPVSHDHLQSLTAQEDHFFTNQFNIFGQVKPGRFRRYTLRFLLWLLDYTARHIYNRGHLTRIQTILFARWVLLDDDKRVYFASNYDGSADSYMDDFINKVAWGLNLVFSNGVGYPRTHWLIKGGAQFEGKYKQTLRRNQLPSESWYTAYPELSAVDMTRNTQIRHGLQAQRPSDSEVREWLSLL